MSRSKVVLAAALAASFGLSAVADAGKGGGHAPKPHPGKALVVLTNTGADANARGRLDVKHFPASGDSLERSWMRFRLHGLERAGVYTLWIDDPATDADPTLVEVADFSIAARGRGNANARIDTETGATLPFGATLDTLAGKPMEIRDVNGVAVLSAAFPTIVQ